MKKNKDYIIGSENVFADLGYKNPEEMLAKAELTRQINDLIKQKNLTQAQAANLLGIDQPKISALRKGRLSGFSLERLFRFLNILGQSITITVSRASSKKKSNVNVSFPKVKKPVIKPHDTHSNAIRIQAKKRK